MTMTSATAEPRPIDIVTFGCRLNACESQALRERAAAQTLTETVVFNTCAVTAEAVRQARQAIRRARRERPSARLVVTGCAAQIDPAAFAAMDEVDLVLGNALKAAPGALLAEGVHVSDVMIDRPPLPAPAGAPAGRARAYVAIQSGCDHRCTFCVIPFGRGNSRSQSRAAVIRQVRALAAAGYAEVVLTGVDLTSWGEDLAGAPKLGDLIGAVLGDVPELPRLRLSSIDAAEIDARLLALLASERRLMPHLHLSLQSGDDLILKRMRRRHSRAAALALVEAVRRARPETAFGADFIAGFPTETEAAFANTLNFVAEAGLAFLHVFPFSPRAGTPAARMPQVAREVVHARARRLRLAGEAALERHLAALEGKTLTALVERPGLGRAEDFTEVAFEGVAAPGSLISGVVAGRDHSRARLSAWALVPTTRPDPTG
ncbi:MAG TPA: tRNA (N(6)-L-threonylcarbamoyladenosine(37)-C(2))-methylthiotransferase MtaB [Caulobacteraceae bacterium]|jgi:threonylcarbamoyladenosine tRNA methylthiotransferase MtaB|nr:tRNA (N(6)-L-threonylcarbamoyladenosine(37)-C(2))-methylthiotransferase MtaB [Caulobacteraceae bacterium]